MSQKITVLISRMVAGKKYYLTVKLRSSVIIFYHLKGCVARIQSFGLLYWYLYKSKSMSFMVVLQLETVVWEIKRCSRYQGTGMKWYVIFVIRGSGWELLMARRYSTDCSEKLQWVCITPRPFWKTFEQGF